MSKYFMGIDGGTGSVRVAVFDESGNNKGYCIEDYPTQFPKSGWAEQNPDDWWNALVKAIPGAIKAAGISAEDITAITCDGTTSTVIFLDENDNLLRNPILWMDVRATDQAAGINTTGHKMNRYYMAGVPAESLVAKCLWVKENQPEIWKKAKTIFEYTNWLHWKLSGRKVFDQSVAAFRCFYDGPNGGWQEDFFNAIGLEDLTEKFPDHVAKTGEIIGNVSDDAVKRFGFSKDCVVVEGAFDACCGMIGVGSVEAGGMAMIGGSSTVLLGLSENEFHIKGVNGTYPDCPIPGLFMAEGGQASSGSILTWFKNNLAPKSWFDEAEKEGVSLYAIIDKYVKQVPIGSEGLIMLDYFQGNRAPYSDSMARGTFIGLSLMHKTQHIARSIMEGVAFGAAHCIQAMDRSGYHIDKIYACGGMAQSALWMQMHADVIGVPIYVTKESQSAGCLGDCMAGAVGTGLYTDFKDAADHMVQIDKVYQPRIENYRRYQFFFQKYTELWPKIADLEHEIVNYVTH